MCDYKFVYSDNSFCPTLHLLGFSDHLAVGTKHFSELNDHIKTISSEFKSLLSTQFLLSSHLMP